MKRRQVLAGAGTSVALGSASASAQSGKSSFNWTMVTSWPKNFPGPGTGAARLVRRIEAMSAGRLKIKLYAAGELVPALGVFDAVSLKQVEMAHTASFFWQGKAPASVFFTAIPFGLTPGEHLAWIEHGGGQALWDELYADFGLRAFMAGNSGMQMGGWFKREIKSLDDLKGLKYRIPGLGGEALRRLGVAPVTIAPPEIFAALQSGTVDGAEFLGPWSDQAAGFYKVAPYYYWPGFHEPNGTAELLVGSAAFASLPADLQAVVQNACQAEHATAWAETEWRNAQALKSLVDEKKVQIRKFPDDVLDAARASAEEVLAEFAAKDPMAQRIHSSYTAARELLMGWGQVAGQAFLNARSG